MKTLVFKYFVSVIILINVSLAQDKHSVEKNNIVTESVNSIVKNKAERKHSLTINSESKYFRKFESIFVNYNFNSSQLKKKEEYSLNIVSSFGENIKFVGFWDKYVIINFTPQMFIRPFDFINIYANQNLTSFIPIENIKYQVKSIALQSAAVLAVDNSIKFLFSSNGLITELIGFAVKSFVINYFIKPSIRKSNESNIPWAEDENYYYSVNVRF